MLQELEWKIFLEVTIEPSPLENRVQLRGWQHNELHTVWLPSTPKLEFLFYPCCGLKSQLPFLQNREKNFKQVGTQQIHNMCLLNIFVSKQSLYIFTITMTQIFTFQFQKLRLGKLTYLLEFMQIRTQLRFKLQYPNLKVRCFFPFKVLQVKMLHK